MSSSKKKIILGVDPGTVVTGYAFIQENDNSFCPLDFGCISPPKKALLSQRYHILFQSLCHLIKQYEPTEMSIETPFVHKNPQSALKLGSALGCAIIAAKEYNVRIYGYPPAVVKKGITGLGRASKEDIELFIKASLHLHATQFRSDASDALAIALYHGMQKCSTVCTANLKEL